MLNECDDCCCDDSLFDDVMMMITIRIYIFCVREFIINYF